MVLKSQDVLGKYISHACENVTNLEILSATLHDVALYIMLLNDVDTWWLKPYH